MPNRDNASKNQLRFLAREVVSTDVADGALGPAVDTLDHDSGITFYVMAEAFTAGALTLTVEEADDAAFTVNQAVLDRDHIVEQPATPIQLAAAQTPGSSNAVRIGVHSTRKFIRLRRAGSGGADMTVVAAVLMSPDITPSGTLSNQG